MTEAEKEAREALIDQATWALIDYDTDVADRGVSDEHYRERRADVERVFPILASRAPQPADDERRIPGFAERERGAQAAWEFFARDDRDVSRDFRAGYHQGTIDEARRRAPQPTEDEPRGYEAAIADLRWLADARDKYDDVHHDVKTARLLAKILEDRTPVSDGGTGFGWLPSWMWDEWDERRSRRRAPAEPATQDESRPQMSEHTAPTGDEAHIRDDLALLIRETDSESDASCDCGHPRVEHDYGVGECYLSGCKCRKWEAATDDHEALVEVMTAATFVDGERRLVGWGPIADAILAAGFRRAPAEPAAPPQRLREQATNQVNGGQ